MPKIRDVYLSGKGRWVRMNTIDKYGKWSLILYLDQVSISEFNKMKEENGILNKLGTDDNGDFVRLSRPQKKIFRGVETIMQPPEVVDIKGEPMSKDIWIGNDSDITAKLTLYSFNKQFGQGTGHAIRLEGIKVTNLVPYASLADRTPDERKQVEGLEKQPVPW